MGSEPAAKRARRATMATTLGLIICNNREEEYLRSWYYYYIIISINGRRLLFHRQEESKRPSLTPICLSEKLPLPMARIVYCPVLCPVFIHQNYSLSRYHLPFREKLSSHHSMSHQYSITMARRFFSLYSEHLHLLLLLALALFLPSSMAGSLFDVLDAVEGDPGVQDIIHSSGDQMTFLVLDSRAVSTMGMLFRRLRPSRRIIYMHSKPQPVPSTHKVSYILNI